MVKVSPDAVLKHSLQVTPSARSRRQTVRREATRVPCPHCKRPFQRQSMKGHLDVCPSLHGTLARAKRRPYTLRDKFRYLYQLDCLTTERARDAFRSSVVSTGACTNDTVAEACENNEDAVQAVPQAVREVDGHGTHQAGPCRGLPGLGTLSECFDHRYGEQAAGVRGVHASHSRCPCAVVAIATIEGLCRPPQRLLRQARFRARLVVQNRLKLLPAG